MHRSLLLIPASKHIWKFVTLESQRHCYYSSLTKLVGLSSINNRTTMPAKKRKATFAKMDNAKQQKLQAVKEGEREREKGWLQGVVAEQRKEKQDLKFNKKRLRFLSQTQKIKQGSEGVVYWMNRDHRVQDNWALIHAQQLALEEKLPLHICVCLDCSALDIQFHLLQGSAGELLPGFVRDWILGAVVTDFSPLRTPLQWVEEVDAHNVVPCWVASDKLEYAARTIRTKITKLLPEFLTEMPLVDKHPHPAVRTAKPVDWAEVLSSLEVDRTVEEVDWAKSGTAAGIAMLESFIDLRLKNFATQRNNPNSSAVSQLSPWIRFGHLSAQRVVLQVKRSGKSAAESVSSFTEELVKTLKDHAKDIRPYVYTRKQLEKAQTHDKLWNAAQYQMVIEGKMHGFLRMYWAKKILEWTSSPEGALSIAIYLNDRYELDGQDPNGFVGCMWSICGIHDQGWAERPIFGKIRYMNYKGCTRKFDVAQFERKYCPKDL
ncbi:unnamed protein product [Coregonus sp. 'balchen']|nr:unnamed protein product [Coregonus sp. 'balchen']